MNMSKKMLIVAIGLALLLASLSCALGEAEAPAQYHRFRLGSSRYTVELDDTYAYGVVSEADAEDGEVAYMYRTDGTLDFEVYQFAKGDGAATPAGRAQEEAALYEAVDELEDGRIGACDGAWYRTLDTLGDQVFETVTYILDDGDDFVEIVFWLDGEDARDEAARLMDSLDFVQLQDIRLGTSPFFVKASSGFEPGEVTEEDIEDDQVAYWRSEDTLLDFDVYQFGKEDIPADLADYVAEEASTYDNIIDINTDARIGDIPVAWYRTIEEYEDVWYETLTCALDTGDEFVEIVFWLDGTTAQAEADAILKSLWREDGAETVAEGAIEKEEETEEEIEEEAEEETVAEEEMEEEAAFGDAEPTDDRVHALEAELEALYDELYALKEEASAGADAARFQDQLDAFEAKLDAFADTLATLTDGDIVEDAAFAGEVVTVDVEAWDELDVPEEEADEAEEEAVEAEEEADEAEEEAVEAEEEAEEAEEELAEPEGDAEDADEAEAEEAEGVDDAAQTYALQLGTTPFFMDVPAGFVPGEMTEEDIEDDQVGYYHSEDTLLDFDVYQFSKDGYPNEMTEYVAWEAESYEGVSEMVTDGEINGVPVCWYRTVEQYEDVDYNTITYLMEHGDEYVEVVFWLDGDTADAEAAAIINTLSLVETPADAEE